MKNLERTFLIFIFILMLAHEAIAQDIKFIPLSLYGHESSCYDVEEKYIFYDNDKTFIIIKSYKIKGMNIGKCGCPSAVVRASIFDRKRDIFIKEQKMDFITDYELIYLDGKIKNDILIKFTCYSE